MLEQLQLRFDRDVWGFLALFILVTLFLFFLWTPLGWLGVIASLWCLYFFRDPPRVSPQNPDLILSPADGLVCQIERVVPPALMELGKSARYRVSIFLDVFDVHVNRVPVAGQVVHRIYEPGSFLNASLDKASEENERNTLVIQTSQGLKIGVVQIAGLVARRIRCDVETEDHVLAGGRFGIIRFGSRVDVYLPPKVVPTVLLGQRMIGGETVIADLAHPTGRFSPDMALLTDQTEVELLS